MRTNLYIIVCLCYLVVFLLLYGLILGGEFLKYLFCCLCVIVRLI